MIPQVDHCHPHTFPVVSQIDHAIRDSGMLPTQNMTIVRDCLTQNLQIISQLFYQDVDVFGVLCVVQDAAAKLQKIK
jgi:hypothetical protein